MFFGALLQFIAGGYLVVEAEEDTPVADIASGNTFCVAPATQWPDASTRPF
jgi:hypothetical protein